MFRHCGTNKKPPQWTFTDPCKPEVSPGARDNYKKNVSKCKAFEETSFSKLFYYKYEDWKPSFGRSEEKSNHKGSIESLGFSLTVSIQTINANP